MATRCLDRQPPGGGPLTGSCDIAQESSCFVVTGSGNVQDLDNGTSCAILGILFAAPPISPLRWNRRSRGDNTTDQKRELQ